MKPGVVVALKLAGIGRKFHGRSGRRLALLQNEYSENDGPSF